MKKKTKTSKKNVDDVEEPAKECPECASSNTVYKKSVDQIVCKDCGAIFEPLDPESEKKFEKVHDLK